MSEQPLSDTYYAIFSRPGATSTLAYDVTWTNLGPLTTTFTPPATCNTPLPSNFFVQGRTSWGYDCLRNEVDDSPRPECYPFLSAYSHTTSDTSPTDIAPHVHPYYYSPAYDCPIGWTGATTLEAPAPSTIGGFEADLGPLGLPATGTQILCCPGGWTVGGLVQCYSSITTSTEGTYCYQANTRLATGNFNWEPTDSIRTILAYTTPAMILLHDGDSPGSGAAAQGGGRGGLSSSAKIAIGVVIPVVVLLALLAGILLLLRRRKRKKESVVVHKGAFPHDTAAPPAMHEKDAASHRQFEMQADSQSPGNWITAHELEGSGRHGVEMYHEPQELGYHTQSRHEVPEILQTGQQGNKGSV